MAEATTQESNQPQPTPQATPEKRCVACTAMIPVDARKCKHCGEWQRFNWIHASLPTVAIVISVCSLLISLWSNYQSGRRKDSSVSCAVQRLILYPYRTPIVVNGQRVIATDPSRADIWVEFQVKNDGSAPAFVEVICHTGGCVVGVDAETGQSAALEHIDPNHSRIFAARMGTANIMEIRKLDDASLRRVVNKAMKEQQVFPKLIPSTEVLDVDQAMYIRTTNQSGAITQNYIVITPKMMFDAIKRGPMPSYPEKWPVESSKFEHYEWESAPLSRKRTDPGTPAGPFPFEGPGPKTPAAPVETPAAPKMDVPQKKAPESKPNPSKQPKVSETKGK